MRTRAAWVFYGTWLAVFLAMAGARVAMMLGA